MRRGASLNKSDSIPAGASRAIKSGLMRRQYSAKTFLRNTPNDLLKEYFKRRGIDLASNGRI